MEQLVVSPHLDDAVFGCGQWLAAHPGATVVTVFAGVPRAAGRCTEWDARCGFASAAEAVEARRAEDRRALALLGARPHWLGFADRQYGETPAVEQVAQALCALLRELRPRRLLFPLGLFHSDHLLVHAASTLALQASPGLAAWAYEDCLYRGLPGVLQARLAGLQAAGVRATPARWPAADGAQTARRKAAAVRAYESQLRAFGAGGHEDTAQPERYWTLAAATASAAGAHGG